MNDYTKGILTGASLILCFFMFVSAKSQSKYLGDIKVRSITVLSDNGVESVQIGEGAGGIGYVSTFNSDGNMTTYLGSAEDEGGWLTTYNKHQEITGYFGTDIDNNGMASLYDRNGDEGWSASGKK